MFQVTTTLPDPHEPISKAKLLSKLKTPKSAEELAAIEEKRKKEDEEKKAAEGDKKVDKKKKKVVEGPKEEDLYNFTDVPLEQ